MGGREGGKGRELVHLLYKTWPVCTLARIANIDILQIRVRIRLGTLERSLVRIHGAATAILVGFSVTGSGPTRCTVVI